MKLYTFTTIYYLTLNIECMVVYWIKKKNQQCMKTGYPVNNRFLKIDNRRLIITATDRTDCDFCYK
jgi:hypothetical protein